MGVCCVNENDITNEIPNDYKASKLDDNELESIFDGKLNDSDGTTSCDNAFCIDNEMERILIENDIKLDTTDDDCCGDDECLDELNNVNDDSTCDVNEIKDDVIVVEPVFDDDFDENSADWDDIKLQSSQGVIESLYRENSPQTMLKVAIERKRFELKDKHKNKKSWTCGKCEFLNPASHGACISCEMPNMDIIHHVLTSQDNLKKCLKCESFVCDVYISNVYVFIYPCT